MSDIITRKAFDAGLKSQTDEIVGVIHSFMQLSEQRFNTIEDKLDDKADKTSLDNLTNTIDNFLKRIDDSDAEQSARDAQFNRLLEWAREVSKKTGVPLPEL